MLPMKEESEREGGVRRKAICGLFELNAIAIPSSLVALIYFKMRMEKKERGRKRRCKKDQVYILSIVHEKLMRKMAIFCFLRLI